MMKSTKMRPAKAKKKSQVRKMSMNISGHQTSICLEGDFWAALNEIAATKNVRTSKLVATIDRDREHANLSSAIRLHALNYYRGRLARE
jgi:predicted DNA-binding ribbon-helix-helix protein